MRYQMSAGILQTSNGRVNLSVPTDASGPGFEYKQNTEKNFQGDMLRGNWEQNALSTAFFSRTNITLIQNQIRRSVYDRSQPKGYVIDDQSADELKIIMRAMYYQYAKNLPTDIPGQVADLNRRVVDWSVPHILSAVDHYYYYLKDIDTLPVPISWPVSLSSAGSRTLPLNPFI